MNKKKSTQFCLLFSVCILLAFISMLSCLPPDTTYSPFCERMEIIGIVKTLDFSPDDGNWIVNWPGPPRRAWTAADVEYFTPTIELAYKLNFDLVLQVDVIEDRGWPFENIRLGRFYAEFEAGKVLPSVIRANNDSLEQSRGLPPRTFGKFWLVVTKAGKLRGNSEKEDNGHANVFLWIPDEEIYWDEANCTSYTTARSGSRREIERY